MDDYVQIPAKIYRHYSLASDEVRETSGRFLDYGCGEGDFIGHLDHSRKHLFGFDTSAKAVALAKKKYPSVNFKVVKVGQSLPYPDEYFDGIFMFHVLEHVDSEKKAIIETYRLLRPGGKLYLSSPYKGLFHWADAANLRYKYPKIHKVLVSFFLGRSTYIERFVETRKNKMFGDCSINRIWHTHYRENEIHDLLKGQFNINKFIKFSLFQPFILIFFNFFYLFLKKDNILATQMVTLDNYISAGQLSYTFFAVATKIKK